MTKRWMNLLEKAYTAEVNGALGNHSRMMQTTKAKKLAEEMVAEGYLKRSEEQIGLATIRGYELTELGRLTYCMSCSGKRIEQ